MIKTRSLIHWSGILILASLLSGCLESTDITIFEPGVYKGASDPLIGSSDAAALESRFANQLDR
jgi:hypothetical protein